MDTKKLSSVIDLIELDPTKWNDRELYNKLIQTDREYKLKKYIDAKFSDKFVCIRVNPLNYTYNVPLDNFVIYK